MNKCYYCGGSRTGCAECRLKVEAVRTFPDAVNMDGETQAQLDLRTEVNLLPKPVWKPLLKQVRQPVKDDRVFSELMRWAANLHEYVKEMDSRINVEVVSEPAPNDQAQTRHVVYARTVFENQPLEKRNRCQQWDVSRLQQEHGDVRIVARYIVDYWKRCRARRDAELVVNGIDGTFVCHCPTHGEQKVTNAAGCPACLNDHNRLTEPLNLAQNESVLLKYGPDQRWHKQSGQGSLSVVKGEAPKAFLQSQGEGEAMWQVSGELTAHHSGAMFIHDEWTTVAAEAVQPTVSLETIKAAFDKLEKLTTFEVDVQPPQHFYYRSWGAAVKVDENDLRPDLLADTAFRISSYWAQRREQLVLDSIRAGLDANNDPTQE